jgi:hypothetical protein
MLHSASKGLVLRSVALYLICLLFQPLIARSQSIPPPRSVEAIASSETTISVYWLPSTDPDATGYIVERDGMKVAELPPNAGEFDDTGLTAGSTYTFTVRTVKNSATSVDRAYRERTFDQWPSALARAPHAIPVKSYDVVVTQASTGGVAAAIEAARRGLKVALIEPTTRVGGMPANGLSATDLRRVEHESGFFVRFKNRVRELYASEGIKATGISYEPRVAHQAMKSLLYEVPGITLFRRARPVRVRSHPLVDAVLQTHIDSVVIEELGSDCNPTGRRAELRAKIFVDSTDCGDIAAWAGAPFRLGREARSRREPHNGVIYYDRAHDRALPGSTGAADNRIMAYTYLLTVKDYGPGSDKTIPKPRGYRKEEFTHSPAWKDSWAVTSGRMPGDKLELNQHPQGGDIQQINYQYPVGNYRERTRIEALYHDHVLAYLYYIQTELGQKQIGLPDDEYRDTGGFPPLLYVREGRRIIGDQTPDETDITEATSFTRPESIGIGDYPMDSHAVRPKTDWNTPDMGEGEWWLYKETPVHQLPIGVMIPRTLDNVFVTTAVSSTHVSFGTYRLEPVRMAFGQAAGIAAELCIRFNLSAHNVPARQIQDELLPHADNPLGNAAVKLTYYPDVSSESAAYQAIEYLTAHGIRLPGDSFKPSAVTTRAELAAVLTQLASRCVTMDVAAEPYAMQAYLGLPADRTVLDAIRTTGASDDPVNRAEFAHWLARLFPHQVDANISRVSHYSDITDELIEHDGDALYAMGIDSVLWDSWKAMTPGGKIKFDAEAIITHEQLYASLYIAQIGIGPLFDDLPSEVAARR